MPLLPRRRFMHSALAGFASLTSLPGGGSAAAEQKPAAAMKDSAPKLEPPEFRDGDPDTLFLTWLRDPTTTITATWIGKPLADDDVAVHVAPLGADAWQMIRPIRRPYPLAGEFVHQAEATRLTPGSQYRLRIGSGKKIFRFQTMPAKATDTFQFVSGGDSGGGDDARATNELAARQDPMFVLMGGDIAYDNGVRWASSLRFLKNYRHDLIDSSQRLIPIVPAIGNHEVAKIDGRTASPFFDALYGGLFPEKTFATLDFGDYLSLVLLDSGHRASIAGEQTDWLDRQLAARRERPHLIVAQHVPSYPSVRPFDNTTGELSRRNFVPLFEKYNVDIVLEHHDHTFKRTHPMKGGLIDKQGLVFLGDGSWGSLRPLNVGEVRPYLAKASSDYHMTLHRLEGEQRFHMAMAHAGRVVDICTTRKRPQRLSGRGA